MSETMKLASESWINSLHSPQIGLFPLAAPAGALSFGFNEGSLAATSHDLRQGCQFELSTPPESPAADILDLPSHWQWLVQNLDEFTEMQVALGLVMPQTQKWCLPIFTAPLQATAETPLGLLRLGFGARLNLNTTVVKILAQKYGVSPQWIKAGKTAGGLNLDAMWEALSRTLQNSPRAAGLSLLATGRVGLARRGWPEVLGDLRKNLDTYVGKPLVKRYATHGKPQAYPPTKYQNLDISKPIYAPLKADHRQLRVPVAFGRQESFILCGAPATGKTTAVVNAVAQGVVQQHSTLVIGTLATLDQLKDRMNQAGLGHLFLTLSVDNTDELACQALKQAWDKPVNADTDYLKTCRQSLTALRADLDIYATAVHEVGPNQLSAWDAYTATLLTAADLTATERDLAQTLAQSPQFPYLPSQRIQAAQYSQQLADLDSNTVGGLAANPWSLMGTLTQVNKPELSRSVTALETAITHAHPAVLEIMSACTNLQTWPLFARWLDLLEVGYGREPVELTSGERREVSESLRMLKARYRELLQSAKPVFAVARDAYTQQLDKRLLADARHAQSSKGFARGSRLKAVLKELSPYLSTPIPADKVVETLEELAKLRRRSEELSALIVSNPLLGLEEIDALAPGAYELFLRHADTILTSVELAAQLSSRQPDLISLIPIAREGGNLGKQVRAIAGSFAEILDILKTQPQQLQDWAQSLPPLARYLQVRKTWSASLTAADSALENMADFRVLESQLAEIGLDTLSQWVEEGKLSGKTISDVLNHALSLAALEERNRSLKQQSFSASDHNAQAERLAATASETRREIANVVQVSAADFAHRLDKQQLRDFGAYLRQEDFSIYQALHRDLPSVLARTPILGLTPEQVAHYLPSGQSRFDALVVLASESLPAGIVVKALSAANQVLFVATIPSSRTFAAGKAPSVYDAAREAGFPEMRLELRYGSKLSPVVPFITKQLDSALRIWPVAGRFESTDLLTLESSPVPVFSLSVGNEAPGWKGSPTSPEWFEKAGNLLINLALRNKNSRLLALTYTADLAAGIRWYLGTTLRSRGLTLPNLQVSHLGEFHSRENQALVFFLGPQAAPTTSKSGAHEELATAFSRALQTVNQRLWVVENRGFDRRQLPGFLRDFLEDIAQPHSFHRPTTNPDFVGEHLKQLLLQAGLEVQGPLGTAPLVVDLAVRGSSEAPWMGILLDTPSWCGISHTIDREVNFPDYLVQHCGFGQVEHIYLDQLINDEDEVTRRIVSLSLDLAFPGDVTEGAVASEDRYSSPARIVAALSQRVDPWETPHDSENNWSLPAGLQQRSPASTEQTTAPDTAVTQIPVDAGIPDSAADATPPTVAADQSLAVASSSSPAPAAEAADKSTSELPPELQIAANIMATLHEGLSPTTTELPTPSVAHPGTLPDHMTDGEILSGRGLNTHSPVPIVFDIPESAFTHLTRQELADTPLEEPTLSERLGTQESAWIADLTTPEETGKITRPGYGAFAPLFIAPEDSPDSGTEAGEIPESKFDATTTIAPQDTEFVPLPDRGEAGIKPFVPRGKPQHDLGDKQVLDNLDDPENAAAVARALDKILYTEGPISTVRLAKLVADAFGMQRLHPKRRDKILALLSPEVTVQTTEFGEFAWPPGTGEDRFKVFRTGSIYGQRALTDICDEEFNNALTWVIATQEPLEEEASEAVARALDLTPGRTAIRSRMSAGLAALERDERLVRKNGRFHLQ